MQCQTQSTLDETLVVSIHSIEPVKLKKLPPWFHGLHLQNQVLLRDRYILLMAEGWQKLASPTLRRKYEV